MTQLLKDFFGWVVILPISAAAGLLISWAMLSLLFGLILGPNVQTVAMVLASVALRPFGIEVTP